MVISLKCRLLASAGSGIASDSDQNEFYRAFAIARKAEEVSGRSQKSLLEEFN
jgi:hypothetical protein